MDFASIFKSTIDCQGIEIGVDRTKELIGGARICAIFDDMFAKELDKVDALEGLADQEINNLVRNSTGLSPNLGVPQQALEWLIKKQLEKLKDPVLR